MILAALTPEECAKHERAIAKIKRKLFAHHTPEDFGIVPGTEVILSATAEERWCAGVGNYRRLTWGGVRFDIVIGTSRYTMTVSHYERDVFDIHVSTAAGHTELAALVKFDAIDRVAWRYVECRRNVRGRTSR